MSGLLSLEDACFYYIVNHVNTFSPAAISLLPSHVRRRLLSFLPAADVWRLERCPTFSLGLDMEEEWRRRIETHIIAWKAPEGLEFKKDSTARESYLYHTSRVLLSSTKEKTAQTPSLYHAMPAPRYNTRDLYKHRALFSYHLHRAQINPPRGVRLDATPELVEKQYYLSFLFCGVHIANAPHLLHYNTYNFDSRKEYHIPLRYTSKENGLGFHWTPYSYTPRYHDMPMVSKTPHCFQHIITSLMQNSGWTPRKLDISAPSEEFLSNVSEECILRFLSRVQEINVQLVHDARFSEVAGVLAALFARLSPTSVCIETKYHYQLSWLLPRLAATCGRLSAHDRLFVHSKYYTSGYSGLRRIVIGTQKNHVDKSHTPGFDWGVILCQDEIESIRLVRLKMHIPTSLPNLLPHLLATRPSLRLLELTHCGLDYNAMQVLVVTFLFTSSTQTQTLIIRDWPAKTMKQELKREAVMPTGVSGPCRDGEYKTLSLSFIPSGACSLAWLLSLPDLRLKTLELTLEEEDYKSDLDKIQMILELHKLSPFPVDDVIVTVYFESRHPYVVEESSARSKLSSCPMVKKINLTTL